MARITNFLKLWLPEADDVYNVEKDQNENFEKIDAKLKEWDEGKENFIKDKKTGFNLDKTNLTENDGDKLFTAKGALDLFNRLTTGISTAVENMKNVLRVDIAKKIDKTSISDSLTSTSTTTVLNSAGAKKLADEKMDSTHLNLRATRDCNNDQKTGVSVLYVHNDATGKPVAAPDVALFTMAYNSEWYYQMAADWRTGNLYLRGSNGKGNSPLDWVSVYHSGNFNPDDKLNVSDAWRFRTKVIGNTTDTTDLNDIIEPGDYISVSAANKWLSLPSGANPAFHLTVESIGSKYRVQTLRHHADNKMFRRVNAAWDRWVWSAWERIDSLDKVNKAGDTMTGNLTINKVDGSYQLQRNGVSKMFLGFRNDTSTDIVLHSNEHGTEIFLNDEVRMNKDIYVNDSKAVTEAEAWRYYTKIIGNITTVTDLNTVIEAGDYRSIDARNKWVNAPSDYTNGAFTLEVEKIGGTYVSQVFKSYFDSRIYKRTYIRDSNRGWTSWERIDSAGLLEKVNAAPVLLFSGSFQMDGGKTLTLPNFSQYRYLLVTVGVENTPERSKVAVLGTMTFMLPVQAPDKAVNMSYSGRLIDHDWFDIRGVNDTQLYCRAGYGVWVHRVYGVYF